MPNEFQKVLSDVNIRSVTPHPALRTWDGKNINHVDWVGEGIVLYYYHGANETGDVFYFVTQHIEALHQKNVKRVYIESQEQVDNFHQALLMNNDLGIAHANSQSDDKAFRSLYARLTMARTLRKNNIELCALQHSTRKVGERPFSTWFKEDIIDRDLNAAALIEKNHVLEKHGPVVALVGGLHVLFGAKLKLPGLFVANEIAMMQLELQLQLQRGKVISKVPQDFYFQLMYERLAKNKIPKSQHQKLIEKPDELTFWRAQLGAIGSNAQLYNDPKLVREFINHLHLLTQHFSLLLPTTRNKEQYNTIFLMAFIVLFLAITTYYCLL